MPETDAIAAAVARAFPHLSERERLVEAAWASGEMRPGGRRINWCSSPLGLALRDRLAEAQNWRCCYCGKPLDSAAPLHRDRPTFEHVHALRDGGPDHPDNLAVACGGCNVARRDYLTATPAEFAPEPYSRFVEARAKEASGG